MTWNTLPNTTTWILPWHGPCGWKAKRTGKSSKPFEHFLKDFCKLAHKNSKATTRIAFLNADWRDFESTPLLRENPDNSITIFDYHRLLSESGLASVSKIRPNTIWGL